MTAALRPNSAATRTSGFFHRALSPQTYRASPHLPAPVRRRITYAAALAALTLTPATAQQVAPPEPSPYTRAIAAGYKALTLCSGIFNARESRGERTRQSIEANELTGIFPEYDALMPALETTIDESADRVLVSYDAAMPPRIARAQAFGGCTILPIGTATSPANRRLRGDLGPFALPPTPYEVAGRIAPKASVQRLINAAFDGNSYGARSKTTAVVITQNGKQLVERYAPGFSARTPQRTWSEAKSVAGTLIGIGVELKLVDPMSSASVPEWQHVGDPRQAITLDNLLRMASGLYSSTAGNRTDAIYFGGTTVTEETVAWPLAIPPNTRFRYANNDILLAVRALQHSYAERYGSQLPPEVLLLDRIGMKDTYAEQDWRGNYILSSQVWSTARDLARLGQFWLQDGVWAGKRLLPEGWMRYMTTPSGPQPVTGPGYGATMWLFGPTQGLPAGSYAAQGNRGQFVMVIPSRKLVIVRRGEDPGTARFDIARFAVDVIAATP